MNKCNYSKVCGDQLAKDHSICGRKQHVTLCPYLSTDTPPSPLTTKIKRKLFVRIERSSAWINFFVRLYDDDERVVVLYPNGELVIPDNNTRLYPQQRKEIERVSEALEWNGETK
jgi:hypothetical protein